MTDVRQERKVVTVLFADLVGFTARAEALDPEDVAAVLRPYHERLRAELERFGGTVEKFIGDAVMALFGAPVAHEDDPERAVRAALAIRDWAREQGEVRVRIAVNTGEALINLGARPESGEGMAAGDVVNTTARMQSAAPVNGVLVGETTYRATRDSIDYEKPDSFEAKGKSEPVQVWVPREARSRFGVDVPQESSVPLIAREREFGLLRDTFARARESSAVQLVTIVGEPGIGKTRLVYELFAELAKGPELTYWRQGRSLPYGEGVTLWALAEMVKAQAGILETDSDAEARMKLRRAVEASVADDAQSGRVESQLLPLIGGSREEALAGDRQESFAAWRRFFEGLAEQRPLVLVFEDLQWADDTLLDFVDYLVDWASGVPILVVATTRPELLERRTGWGGGKRNSVTISLEPLTYNETAKLVGILLDRPVLPAETQALLLERAGGNPLYAEQYARIFTERQDAGDLPLPESVQGIIAARLDLLPPEEKSLLQDASVLGKVFWSGAVAALSGMDQHAAEERLHGLERKEFVQISRRSSVAGEREYAFRHLLVRDVSYGQIPRAERGSRHRRAAEWIESLGRTEDHAEMLVHHYANALDLARAAGERTEALAANARVAFRDAADRAFSLNAFAAAAGFYERALELVVEDDERRELAYGLAQALHALGDDRRFALLAKSGREFSAVGQPSRAAVAEALLAEGWWQRGQRARCSNHLARARELITSEGSSPEKARVLGQIGRYLALGGEFEEALRVNSEVLLLADELGLADSRAMALSYLGMVHIWIGHRGGFEELEKALELALEVGSSIAGNIHSNIAAFRCEAGQWGGGYRIHAAAVRTCEQVGNATALRHLRVWAARGAEATGLWDEAVRLADRFIAECEAGSPHILESRSRMARAAIRLARDDENGATDDMDSGLEISRRGSEPQEVPVFTTAARISFELGRSVESLGRMEEALALSSQSAMGAAYGHQLAWIAEDLERTDEVRQLLQMGTASMPAVTAGRAILDGDFVLAGDVFEESGAVTDAARARLRAAHALAREGRREEVDCQLAKALAFYRSVGATRYIREGEALLAATA